MISDEATKPAALGHLEGLRALSLGGNASGGRGEVADALRARFGEAASFGHGGR